MNAPVQTDATRRTRGAIERTHSTSAGSLHACSPLITPPATIKSIQTVPYVTVTVGRGDLDSRYRPDQSRGGGYNMALVTGFAGSPEPWQPDVRPVERLAGSAHIEDIATRVDQDSDPAGPGDLLRCLTWGWCVHGAIVFHDLIRHKDKDPSFSAKQTRANDERVWTEIHECPLLALSVRFDAIL